MTMLQLKYLIVMTFAVFGVNSQTIVTRSQWGAANARSVTAMAQPVPVVVIHHAVTGSCTTQNACSATMRSMQNHHMNTNGWADIGYNFAAGGDGRIYEGRGWARVGAHAPNYNSRSIGINFIGTFTNTAPPAAQLNVVRQLITNGVNRGSIARNYRLVGHRQVSSTECPGNALYNVIRTWPNWTNDPGRAANETLPEILLKSLATPEQIEEEFGSA